MFMHTLANSVLYCSMLKFGRKHTKPSEPDNFLSCIKLISDVGVRWAVKVLVRELR